MKKAWRHVVFFSVVLWAPLAAHSFTCSGNTCTVTATYTEPALTENGQPETGLKDTVLELTVNAVALAPLTATATQPNGGGTITKTATVSAPVCSKTTIGGNVIAEDLAGNQSKPGIASLLIDRTNEAGCGPAVPGNFTLQ